MKVYLLPNCQKPEALQAMAEVGVRLCGLGADILLDNSCAGLEATGWYRGIFCRQEEAFAACDIVMSIGGDGSMLHAARLGMQYQKPLVGLNTGRLGFLTGMELDETDKLQMLVQEEYTVEERGTICARLAKDIDWCGYALNDIVLFKQLPEKTISLDIYCDDILVSSFRGDGVIFSTPTGSTAYSMSAGGPIVDARVGSIIVTQICAHIVQTPPMVFSADRVFRVVSTGAASEGVAVCCDGVTSEGPQPGEAICIEKADWRVPLIQFSEAEQLRAIDKKLKGR